MTSTKNVLLLALLCALVTVGCAGGPATGVASEPVQRAEALFEKFFEEDVALSPEWLSYLGRRERYDEWDDYSLAGAEERLALYERQLAELRAAVKPAELDAETRRSFEIFIHTRERALSERPWLSHDYPVNQMFGVHSSLPSFLINTHTVTNEDDARAYVARLGGVPRVLEQVREELTRRADADVILPSFLFPKVLRDIDNLMDGKPFAPEATADSALLSDFRKKVAALELAPTRAQELLSAAERALREDVGPAYTQLRELLVTLGPRADDRAGVWKLPDGEAYYNHRLRYITSTDFDADALHELGLREVKRIHGEMREIMHAVGFDGPMQDFFAHMRDSEVFRFADSDAGRARYLQMITQVMDGVRARLDEWFLRRPRAALEVRPVEAFREASAGSAFYESPAEDGSRPGIYYINLHRMDTVPWYEAEALAYHEGLPGHHMQIALAQEAPLPAFRRYAGNTAYVEGWGLYAEFLPREHGLYTDPYSDFGRLTMELWRACRLVVDTGLHARRWTRAQAANYLRKNTPNSEEDVEKSVDRYIVMPGQAVAYKVGMLEILALRKLAQEKLGQEFDLREFHEWVLGGGAMPLSMVRERVEEEILSRRASDAR